MSDHRTSRRGMHRAHNPNAKHFSGVREEFQDTPERRWKLNAQHQKLVDLIDNDPACPPPPKSKPKGPHA